MKIEDIFSDLPQLETQRTLLRKVRKEDEADMFDYCSDEEAARHTTWERHRTIDDTRQFIHYIMDSYENQRLSTWGIEDKATGKFIGTCDFINWNTRHARAEIGYALSKMFWGKGYMTEIVKKLIEFGFSKMELARVEAYCLPENIGSARVMEKAGMSFEGILRKRIFVKGKHRDLKLYAIVK